MMKNLSHFLMPFREKIQSFASNKIILVLIGGSFAIVLLVALLVISVRMNHNQDGVRRTSQERNQLLKPRAINPEELFLPDEPDFLPEVMLDREPRSSWTDEDAEQFWNDPLNEGSDVWKDRIFKAVDDMMEHIP